MSLRYGTVPIVRETGGLKDTVEPYNEYEGTGTGFSFCNYNAHEMLISIRLAMVVYFNRKREGASKMLFVQEAGANPFSLSYAIDRQPGDLTLSEITRGAIDYLFQKSNRGFFLMVEGGKIDWACHSNDGATIRKRR